MIFVPLMGMLQVIIKHKSSYNTTLLVVDHAGDYCLDERSDDANEDRHKGADKRSLNLSNELNGMPCKTDILDKTVQLTDFIMPTAASLPCQHQPAHYSGRH